MLTIASYEQCCHSFRWSDVEQELGYMPGDTINIGWHCSDRICAAGKGAKLALVWEGMAGEPRRYTFDDLRLASNTVGAFLRSLQVAAGDRVCLFMDRIPELYLAFLGVLKIGAVVQPLFSAFGEESLRVRLADAATTTIITQRKHLPKVRRIIGALPCLARIIVVDHDGGAALQPREVAFALDACDPVRDFSVSPTTAESASVLHYTSGTTGQPKGVQHVHASLLTHYITAKWVLDLTERDIYWCTADPGWVTGTSYGIIGPWCRGVTQCVMDKGFSATAWYTFIEKHKVSVWYSAPTAIRSLMKAGDAEVTRRDLSSLRHLASVGEPLNAEAVMWSQRVFGKPFHDTYWQTETGGIMIANYPGMNVKPGSMGKPFPGITAAVLDERTGAALGAPHAIGMIAFKPGWPAMMRGYWNNARAYAEKFRNGWYVTGDRARIDEDGYFWFVGRNDDVINAGGHLVSPFEVESVLLEHPAVAESAVVAKPDAINMEVVKAFVALKAGHPPGSGLELELMNYVRKKLSSIAMPQEITFVDALPRTRSGKIMRRLLRAQEWGVEAGDTSTLESD
jgi:acetyl-CoA synthetase